MLVRWASEEECCRYGLLEADEYEALAAIDRMTGNCLGTIVFSREAGEVKRLEAYGRDGEGVRERLLLAAKRQLMPQGGSFHYRYPQYAREAKPEDCPCCRGMPAPEGMEDIAVLSSSWVSVEERAQGRLFGKCVVIPKAHCVHFSDMPAEEMTGFMRDVQRTGKALLEVTGAVKINYEMHANSGAHLHIHLFPRYLDDDFPSAPIDYRITEPSPYESREEYRWFIEEMRRRLK